VAGPGSTCKRTRIENNSEPKQKRKTGLIMNQSTGKLCLPVRRPGKTAEHLFWLDFLVPFVAMTKGTIRRIEPIEKDRFNNPLRLIGTSFFSGSCRLTLSPVFCLGGVLLWNIGQALLSVMLLESLELPP
jgi:hypothetical protein